MDGNKKIISATENKSNVGTKFIVTNTFVGKKNLSELLVRLAVREAKEQKLN